MKAIYLKTRREAKGWTQERLEQESGVAQSIISVLENADGNPRSETLLALAAALDVDPRALRFGPDPKRQERVAS